MPNSIEENQEEIEIFKKFPPLLTVIKFKRRKSRRRESIGIVSTRFFEFVLIISKQKLKRALTKKVKSGPEKAERIVSTRGDLASACLPVRMPRSKSRLHRRVACFSSSSSSAKSILSSLYLFHFPRWYRVYWKFNDGNWVTWLDLSHCYNNTFVFGRLSIICLFDWFEFVRRTHQFLCLNV